MFDKYGKNEVNQIKNEDGSAMKAGLATLRYLKEQHAWRTLEELGRYAEERLCKVLEKSPVQARLVRIGSIFWIAWGSKIPPRTAENINKNAELHYSKVFHGLLKRGIALAPSVYEVNFLSLAHTKNDVDRLAESLADVLEEIFSETNSQKMQIEPKELTRSTP